MTLIIGDYKRITVLFSIMVLAFMFIACTISPSESFAQSTLKIGSQGADVNLLAYDDFYCRFAGKINANSVRFRKSPSGTVICHLNKGDYITVAGMGETIQGWVKVRYNGNVGYVSQQYVDILN